MLIHYAAMPRMENDKMSLIKVKLSDGPDLHLPASLGDQLGLTTDDQVEVVRSGHVITLGRPLPASPSKPLRQLAGLIKSSQPTASVDVGSFMTQRGYEDLNGRQDSQID
jgi:hypothetical protein